VRVSVEHGLSAGTEAEWDRLSDETGAPPFLRPGWFERWRRAFGRGDLVVLACRHGGEMVAVAPFEVRRTGWRAPANWHTPAYAVVARDDEAAGAAVRGALEAARGRLDLGFVDAGSVLETAAMAAGERAIQRVLERSPYVEVNGTWADFEAGLDGSFRRELGRRTRRLAEQGATAFDVTDGLDGLDGLLAEGFAVERSGWKGTRRTAIADQPATEAFYRSLARWAAERGWLRLALLRVDGRPVAFDLSLEDGGIHYLLKTGYDPAFARHSPGNLLRRHMLGRAFDEKLLRYEFLGADEPWKLDWTPTTQERLLVQTFPRSVAGAATWAAFAHGRPLARRALGRTSRRRAATP
jgi:CelD/BcsL family acetyltransferase involved in cellulose biosynthesis